MPVPTAQVGLDGAVVVRAAGGHQIEAAGQIAELLALSRGVATVDGLDAGEPGRGQLVHHAGQVGPVEAHAEGMGQDGHPARGRARRATSAADSRALGT